MPYLGGTEVMTRLTTRFPGLPEVTIGDGDAAIASAEFDAMAPFIGIRKVSGQENAFPRSVNPDGTANDSADAPDIVLDLVCLFAHRTTAPEEEAALTSWSRSGVSETYSTPVRPKVERLIVSRLTALQPYLRYSGRTSSASITYYPRSFESCPD